MRNVKFTILKPFLSLMTLSRSHGHASVPTLNVQNVLVVSTEILYPIY